MANQVHSSLGIQRAGTCRRRRGRVAAGALLAALFLTAVPVAFGAQAKVGLGTAGNFAVLAGSTVSNTGPSVISGDVGLDPGSAVIGFPPAIVVGGTTHVADGVSLQAKTDLVTAYNDAAGRSSTATVSGDLAGRTLTSGVYTSSTSMGLSGVLTLDAQGDPNAVFIFQAGSSLTIGSSGFVNLIGGAQACNVFWQVGSSATLGTGSAFVGNILAMTSITLTTGATLQGSALARNGAVTLDTNTITRALCATPTSGGTTTPATTTPTTTTTVPGGTTVTAPTGAGSGPASSGGTTRPTTPVTRAKHPKPTKPKAKKPTKHKPKRPRKPVKPKRPRKPVKPTPPKAVPPTSPSPPAFTG